jgi:hypothetical protein
MIKGAAVEIQKVWAGGSRTTLRAWFKGYAFESTDGTVTKVRHTEGMYEGIVVNYPAVDVRAVQS